MMNVSLFAQTAIRPILERDVSIKVNDADIAEILKDISRQANFSFSYSPELISGMSKVNLNLVRKSVREVLNSIFNGKVTYKPKHNYLILLAAPVGPATDKSKEFFIISGYVTDKISGEKIPAVSLYDGKSMISAITNQYGYFSIKLEDPRVQLNLRVSKQNYLDTIVVLRNLKNQSLSIGITPNIPLDTLASIDSLREREFTMMDFLIPDMSAINAANITDTIYRPYQVSFIPKVGTNMLLSGNVINDFSFNVLGGYSLGTRKLEIGGLFNIDRGDVQKVQLAGLLNAVGGNVDGVQMAGYFNLDKGKVQGVQIAGFGNLAGDTVKAVQIGGFFNFNRRYSKGVQVGGFFNVNLESSAGFQMAGFFNSAIDTFSGVQVAGFFNAALKNVNGTQIAGFTNFTRREIHGAQISAFFNYASKVNGSQVALINYADSCTGIPVGFLSYVRSGYHHVDVTADELFYSNLAISTGVREFHNIIFVGIRPDNFAEPLWTFGYGVGSSIKLNLKNILNFNLTAQQIVKNNVFDKADVIGKFTVAVDHKFNKHIALTTGPVLNAHFFNAEYKGYPEIFTKLKPKIFYRESFSSNLSVQMWIGWKLGIRFT
ncbi:hypothetical protein BH11BAC2_BH11BAC2_11520 [soil metagenome]